MGTSNTRRDFIIGTLILAVALAGLVLYALQTKQVGTNKAQSDATPSVAQTTDQDAPAPGDRMAITYTDSGFEPQNLTVKKGTVITLTNASSHNVQFSSNDHPAHTENTEMNMATLAPGESDSYTATKTGTWGFHDHIEGSKTGTITVTN